MKFVLVFLLVISPITDLNEVARINEHKKAGNEAFQNGKFEIAVHHYQFLIDSLEVREEAVMLNLANALFNLKDTTNARNLYNSVVNEGISKKSKSVAHQQLGLMDYGGKKYKEALGQFKNAIKNDPTNEEARYNYELLKKLIEEQEENQEQKEDQESEDQEQENKDQENQDQENQDQQKQDQENQDQEKQDQENQEEQDQEKQDQEENQEQQQEDKEGEEQKPEEGEESEENPENIDPTTAEKLEEMNISEEKAEMILEALKNNEVQYIQQNKRKAKKRKKDGKPDW